MNSQSRENMKKEYIANNSAQTKKLGEKLAQKILRTKNNENAIVIGLEGELGGGKTTLLQGFAKGLGIKEKILSPTFVIMRRFGIKNSKSKFKNFYHFDCYRLIKPKEILDIGFKNLISDSENIVAIEWADKLKRNLPKNAIWLKFEFLNEEKRKIMIK